MKILIKLGGTLLDAAGIAPPPGVGNLRGRRSKACRAVVVHGGGKQMTRYLADRGIESRFVNGLRVTTPEVLDAVVKVLAGSVNQELVAAFVACGAPAVGLSGMDALLTEARQMSEELGWVGKPVRSDARLLNALIEADNTCRSSPAWRAIARAISSTSTPIRWRSPLQALFARTNCCSLPTSMASAAENNVTYSTLNPEQCRQLIDGGIATGGMRAKLESAVEALEAGTAEVVIAPGAAPGIVENYSQAMPSAPG